MTEPESPSSVSMDEVVSLCKRRGFIFPASEIYGGINGLYDFGPLGTELKNCLRDAWWQDMVRCPPVGPNGQRLQMVGLDTSIIQNPRVWEASGHIGGFNDPMIDCRASKRRYRADHLMVYRHREKPEIPLLAFLEGEEDSLKKKLKKIARGASKDEFDVLTHASLSEAELARVVGPDTNEVGTLTEPRDFNLMFKTYVGALQSEDSVTYLRPETAQGIFLNFKNVVDTSRVRVPFGVAQVGRCFRNEVTPRNYIFRVREFEQMEIEWFCHEDEAPSWYEFWCATRKNWWRSLGLRDENLLLRSHEQDELAHYAKSGCGTFDIEYRFPFTAPGFGELEGVAHRGNFDLTQHQEHSRTKLQYFDAERGEKYVPHVIEPSAGLTRGVLAVLCDAYTHDESRPSKMYMKFHPRLAPVKAAVFPLVRKDGMPEIADRLYDDLVKRWPVQIDHKQAIGKRYARMDEAGTPFCFTVDGETATDQSVTVRDRDSLSQERIALDRVADFLEEKIA